MELAIHFERWNPATPILSWLLFVQLRLPPTKLRDSHSKRAAYRNGYGSEKELPKGPQVRPSLVNIKVGAERLVEDSWGCLIKGQCSHPIPVGNFWSQCQISSASFPAHMQCGKPNNNRFPMLP